MMIVGLLCIGFGFGVMAAGLIWWNAGYRAGYHDCENDINALTFGGGDVANF